MSAKFALFFLGPSNSYRSLEYVLLPCYDLKLLKTITCRIFFILFSLNGLFTSH